MRELLVLRDRRLVLELPDADERGRRLVRQDREVAIQLRRIGRVQLRRDAPGKRLGDTAVFPTPVGPAITTRGTFTLSLTILSVSARFPAILPAALVATTCA
ncbi:MAG: hypothetical protein DME05_24690 [Candidatus Rokuibacteriota bacterium]|nr:MAG: hypothetical protein DME05_24690 [Candidatus Rokubacteria bacterium]